MVLLTKEDNTFKRSKKTLDAKCVAKNHLKADFEQQSYKACRLFSEGKLFLYFYNVDLH